MSDFVPVLNANALSPGQVTTVTVNGNNICVANHESAFHAPDNRCPHRGGHLGDGELSCCDFICPLHQYRVPDYMLFALIMEEGTFLKQALHLSITPRSPCHAKSAHQASDQGTAATEASTGDTTPAADPAGRTSHPAHSTG